MKSATLALRKALALALNNVVYSGVRIPVYEEYVQPTSTNPIAVIASGNMTFQAYIIVTNQTENDNSSKCLRNDETSVQVQIFTVFPQGKGGSINAEMIGEVVTGILFTSDGLFSNLALTGGLQAWKGNQESARNINFNDSDSRTWMRSLLLTYSISQS